jgi:hypothetical protein
MKRYEVFWQQFVLAGNKVGGMLFWPPKCLLLSVTSLENNDDESGRV